MSATEAALWILAPAALATVCLFAVLGVLACAADLIRWARS